MKKFLIRSLSMVLTLILTVTMVTFAVVPAQAGLIANALSGNFSAIAVGAIERIVTTAISKAAGQAEDETVAEVLSWTSRILSGYQSVVNKTLIANTEEISKQLDDMYSAMTTEFDSVQDKLNQVVGNQEKDPLLAERNNIINRAYYYEGVIKDFHELLSAFLEYNQAENPSEEDEVYENLSEAYRKVYQQYSSSFDNTMMDTREKEMFDSPINSDQNGNKGLLEIISPYDPNKDIYDDNGQLVLADVSKWGNPDPFNETYLDLMRAYAETIYNFESNVYPLMVGGANEIANTVSMYITAYKYYVDFNTMLINNDEIKINNDENNNDGNLSEEQKKDAITDLNNNFKECSYKLIRAINQMFEDNKDVFTTYMRPYDATATVTINGYASSQKMSDLYSRYENVNLPSDAEDKELTFTLVEYQNPQVQVHQFKLANEKDNIVYAIKTNTEKNIIGSSAHPIPGDDSYTFSLSMFNFLKGTTNGLKTIKSVDDIYNIIKNNFAYKNSDTLINNIKRELGYYVGSVMLYSVAAVDVNAAPDAYMLLDSDITWDGDKLIFPEVAPDMTWLDVSKTTPKEVIVDAEEDVHNSDIKNKELLVMYKGSPTVSLSVNAVSSDGVANGVGEVYIDSNCVVSNNGSAQKIESSKPMTIKVTPDEDAYVSSIVLKNSNGATLDTLYSGTQMDYASVADNYGAMELSMPVPCQNAVIEVRYSNFIDEYTVNLSSADANTTILFEDGTEGLKNFDEGETVKFNVLPDEGYVVHDTKVNDENGNAVSTSVTDISGTTGVVGAQQYSFTMPESNVNVVANSRPEYGYDFIIYNYDDLCEMRDNINSDSVLTLDGRQIPAKEARYILVNDIICPDGANWSPVVGFNGSFDGRGYAIKNLTVTDSSLEKAALFESIGENGTVMNLTLENLYIEAGINSYAGGIAVENNGYITACHISGLIKTREDITFSEENAVVIGSVSAQNAGKITDCTSSCNIYADDGISSAIVGGITGLNSVIGEIKGSSNSGKIEAYSFMNVVGGLSGISAGIQQTSFNEGNILTHGWVNAGGISGYAYKGLLSDDSIVKTFNCYNIGDLTVKEYNTTDSAAQSYYDLFIAEEGETIHVGGVFGMIENTSASGMYNAGNITKYGENLYGIIGEYGNKVTVNNYYYLVSDTTEITDEAQKYESEFKSGEVTYLLNEGVTDGTQVWYQTVGVGYPVFSGKTVYQVDEYATCDKSDEPIVAYANTDSDIVPDHNYEDGICINCGACEFELGDVNGDGEVTINDATIVQKYLAHIDTLSEASKMVADVNGDGKITIRDVTYIQMFVVKMIEEFPVNQ